MSQSTPGERSAHARLMARKRWANATPEQRKAQGEAMRAGRAGKISTPTFKLSYELAEQIRADAAAGVPRKDICEKYGLNKHTVGQMIRGQIWTSPGKR